MSCRLGSCGRPKDEPDGLGVLDLRHFWLALRLRCEWLHKTNAHRTWIYLPSSSERVVTALFQATRTLVDDGLSTVF